ncbi:MAG: glycosyltransferase [Burkholderiales bacterium]|nr:glycosyltransferase [Burkholderiales bacterium]
MDAPVHPRTSVVIPARNAATTLAETLDSLLGQTDPSWEALVVDDGSSDSTSWIIGEYAARDPRLVALQGPAAGVSAGRIVAVFG